MARWYSVLAVATTLLATHVAKAEESVPDMLRRVAPSVVRILVDKEPVGSGFVYPTPRHVVTSYTAVNHDGTLWVETTASSRLPARVVAWSEKHDVAILELMSPLPVPALQLEPNPGFAGQQVVLLGRPTLRNPDEVEEPHQRDVATPRFGFVGLVSPGELNVDVSAWRGDDGAPILTTSGRVLGVVSGKADQRMGLVDVASGSRIVTIQKRMDKQGAFEPHPPERTGVFAGFYVSPWQAYHLVGAGALSGFRYKFLTLTAAANFAHASFAPLDADRMRARWVVASELYGTLDWSYTAHRKLRFGAGLAVTLTAFEERNQGQKVDLKREDATDIRLDPLLVLQDVEGPFLFGVAWAPVAQAARLDIGVVFGL